jgi:uncharacterized damage-inducible protein DinB
MSTFSRLVARGAAQMVSSQALDLSMEGRPRVLLAAGVADVDAAYETLSAKGVRFLRPPTDQPWGLRTAYFADPEGISWEINQPINRKPMQEAQSSSSWEHSIRSKEQTAMTEQTSPLVTFYKPGWENYQQAVVQTIAPLSSEQLALTVALHYVSIGELLTHMIGARINWFSGWMGEENTAIARWLSSDESAVPEAADLTALFEETWRVISSALDRWTWADLEQLIVPPASHQARRRAQGLAEAPAHTRQWIVWHVMEHEIHHGGELSLALGTCGINSFYTW